MKINSITVSVAHDLTSYNLTCRRLTVKSKTYRGLTTSIIGIFFLAGFAFAAENETEALKVSNRIVSVSTNQGLQPATLESTPGTTVIWVNHSRDPVEILFLDKKVTLACGSPVNFFVGKDGAYESAKIPFGGTASLCFTEKGKFDYVFKASATFYPLSEKEHRGIIWIK
jgi:plastocyanin